MLVIFQRKIFDPWLLSHISIPFPKTSASTVHPSPSVSYTHLLEAVVEGKADFKPWGPFSDIEILEWEGFVPDLKDADYVAQLKARMQDRLDYVTKLDTAEGGFNRLPADAAEAIRQVVEQANTL